MPVKLFRALAISAPFLPAFLFLSLIGFSAFAQESTTRSNVDAVSPVPLETKESRTDVDSGGNNRVGTFGLSAFALTAVPRGMVNEGNASVFTYFYPSLNYKFSSTQRFAIRPVFLIDSKGERSNGDEVPTQARGGDLRLVYSDYEMARYGDFTTFGGSTYWDYPSSETSLNKKILSKFSGWYRLTQVISPRFSVVYNIKPELVINSRSSTKNFGRFSNNKLAEWDHYVEFIYDVNRVFAPAAQIGYKHEFLQADPGINRDRLHEDYFKAGFGSWIHAGRNLGSLLSFRMK